MKLKKLLLAGIITTMLPVSVNAETFTDGNNIYDLNERKISCVEKFYYEDKLKDGTLIYVDPNATKITDTFIKVGSDNTCSKLDESGILKMYDELDYNLYEIWVESENKGAIYHTVEHMYYIDGYKKATEYTAGKSYHTNTDGNYSEIGELDETTFNSGEYYEFLTFKFPSKAEIDNSIAYYETTDGVTFTKVNSPTKENILNYFIVTDEEIVQTTKVKDLSTNLLESLSKIEYKRLDVVTSVTEKEFYIIAYMNDDFDEWSIYDETGNLLFEKVSWFTTILDELYAVTKDNKTYIYNKNMEVIYTSSEDLILEELGFSKNISSLSGINRKMFQLIKTTKEDVKKDTTPDITNPETSDGIMNTIITVLITGIGLVLITLLQRKQKNN